MAEYPIKPILSLSKSVLYGQQLTELGAIFSEDGLTAKLNGVVYSRTSLGQYLGLNAGELCTSNGDVIESEDEFRKQFRVKQDGGDISVGWIWDNSGTNEVDPYVYFFSDSFIDSISKKPGILYISTGTELVPLLNSNDSNILDIIEFKNKLLSKNTVDLFLRFLGFNDLINSFIIQGNIISLGIEGDTAKLFVGAVLSDEAIRLKNRCTYNQQFIKTGFHEGTTDQYVYYEDDEKIEDGVSKFTIGGCTESWLKGFDDYILRVDEDLRKYQEEVVGTELDNITTKFEEVTSYGDISDYISLKTLVNVDHIEATVIPTGLSNRLKSRIKQNSIDAKVGTRWDGSKTSGSDPYLYYFTKSTFETIDRKIKLGDLIELSILYKLTDNRRIPITWNNNDVQCTGVPNQLDNDPFVYYTNFTEDFCKLNFTTYNDDGSIKSIEPLTFEGYHITYGLLNEYSYNVRLQVLDSFIQLDDKFMVQITEDSISLFPTYGLISEYYIKSCKLLKTE